MDRLPPDAWISPANAAERLEVNVRTIYRWIKSGNLEASKLGRRCVRVSWESCVRFLEARRIDGDDQDG